MLHQVKLRILLQGLTLLMLFSLSSTTSLGLTVHVVPLDSSNGETVHAHFSAIAPSPCPSLLGLCVSDEDCVVHTDSLPFNGSEPKPGWCVRQWQKTVPYNYSGTITLGSSAEMFVSLNATPVIRGNTGRLNHPAFVALPPPLRARVNCPHHFHLSTKDLDGDKVQCRFARAEQGECVNCTQHSFIELNEGECTLTFTGNAPAGKYYIYLMAEDRIPVPKSNHVAVNNPMSAIPVHLSLTVEESTTSCSDEPVATGETPNEDSTLFVLPYEEVKFRVQYVSQKESVSEVAVVGPPHLFRVGFQTVGPLAMMTMAWIRSPNNLTRLLPICFAVNTDSLQSEPRCVWLYQREMRNLPEGTVLTCEKTEMVLVLPISSLTNINLAELQLNSPSCPVSYNSTHVTARISLDGCGTKTVHSGSELVYTNTLHSVRPFSVVRRKPNLILPLACRIPSVHVQGPQYQITMPTEEETFGVLRIWLEIHLPGEGPLANFTRSPIMRTDNSANRVRREVGTGNSTSEPPTGSRYDALDLQVLSNCSIKRAEMIVKCSECASDEYTNCQPLIDQGCSSSNSATEIVTSTSTSKVYRLHLKQMVTQDSTMYIQCRVNLCITTTPSQKCPNLCGRSLESRVLVGSLFTKSYTVNSGPVSLVVTTAAPTTVFQATEASGSLSTGFTNSTSHAPKHACTAMAPGVMVTTLSMFLQNIFLH